MHWSLCCARVCVCVCVHERVTRFVPVSLNLLKTYVHPALPPPAPPQAFHVSTASRFAFPVSPACLRFQTRSSHFLYRFCRFGLLFQVCRVQFGGLAEVWRIQGRGRKAGGWTWALLLKSWRVRYLCHTVAWCWAVLSRVGPITCSAQSSAFHIRCSERHKMSVFFLLTSRQMGGNRHAWTHLFKLKDKKSDFAEKMPLLKKKTFLMLWKYLIL